jgi:hypothetical protein
MQFRRELKTNPRVVFGPILGLSESFVLICFLLGPIGVLEGMINDHFRSVLFFPRRAH